MVFSQALSAQLSSSIAQPQAFTLLPTLFIKVTIFQVSFIAAPPPSSSPLFPPRPPLPPPHPSSCRLQIPVRTNMHARNARIWPAPWSNPNKMIGSIDLTPPTTHSTLKINHLKSLKGLGVTSKTALKRYDLRFQY